MSEPESSSFVPIFFKKARGFAAPDQSQKTIGSGHLVDPLTCITFQPFHRCPQRAHAFVPYVKQNLKKV